MMMMMVVVSQPDGAGGAILRSMQRESLRDGLAAAGVTHHGAIYSRQRRRHLLSRLHSRLTKVSTVSPSHLDPGSPAVFRYSAVASGAGIIRGNGLPPRDCFPRGAAVGACGGGDAGEERGGGGSRGIFGGDGGGVYGE